MATFKAVVLAGNTHLKSDGTKNIKIRIYHNKSSQYISTPYYIQERYLRDGVTLPEYRDAALLNFEIGNIIQKYRSICLKLGVERSARMSCSEIKEQIIAAMEPEYEFIDFVAFSNELIDKTEKDKTKEWYQGSIRTLTWYYKREKIDVRDITAQRMNELKEQLSVKGPKGKPLEPGAISNYLRGIRAIFNKAKLKYNNLDYDIVRIPNEPFNRVKIPKYRRARKNLSTRDIIRIRDGQFSNGRANMARDVFMMMFYMMGININDLFKLRTLTHGRIEYERSKTTTDDNTYQFPLSIRIEPELEVLIKRYSDIAFLSYFRRQYSNVNNFMRAVNIGLKEISDELHLGCKVTTNWARHSWASIARNKADVPKADIDFCLGHVNNDYKMADIYIDIDYSIFDKSNRAVLDLLKNISEKKSVNSLP
ncbi:MAG: phage integrase SAM-like domain-containing protein [Parabacteroides sp.]|nr:phage integrase SAM-like domain-containing protein [Parabacteroides sp.]